ncbi:MAG TPA: pilus assembly protein TadG-related protein [Candidatus Limnocylindrales bacterium]
MLSTVASPRADRARTEQGQILVVFVLAMVAIIGVVGLAIDGGGAYAQRRDQQTAADLAALAAANDYLLSNSSTQATTRAQTLAATNNFTNGAGSTNVDVSIDTSNGVEVAVTIRSPHRNSFLGALGMANWDVTTSATALAGFPDSAAGAGPFIFSIGAFNDDGTPKYQTSTDFGEGNGDVPISDKDIAWTNYGTGNVNTSEVRSIIDGSTTINATLTYGEYIGQHNNGNHTALYGDVDTYLSGKEMPVAIVDAAGNFMGWATFHVNSASGGSSKHINGYFLSSFTSAQTTVSSCSNNACPRYLGTYVLKLVN